jgi:protein SCO1/2
LLRPLAGIAVAAAALLGWMLWSARPPAPQHADSPPITTLEAPRALAPFTLRDAGGTVFDLSRLRDRWSLLFFGFTSCPDVCPTTLASLARLRGQIDAPEGTAPELQIVFVSVDPQRDVPQRLEQYVKHFDARAVGVTGSEAGLTQLARQLGASFRVEYREGAADYPVAHSTAVFLIDPLARLHGLVQWPFEADAVARRFLEVRARFAADP